LIGAKRKFSNFSVAVIKARFTCHLLSALINVLQLLDEKTQKSQELRKDLLGKVTQRINICEQTLEEGISERAITA